MTDLELLRLSADTVMEHARAAVEYGRAEAMYRAAQRQFLFAMIMSAGSTVLATLNVRRAIVTRRRRP